MNYEQRINKVIDFIGQHLDENLNLDQLSAIACFSKYHFHRLFTACMGLSLQQYIRWLRLKRAAHQLIMERNRPIIDIAMHAGFESHETFTRAFKQACGFSPKAFREKPSWQVWERPTYTLPKQGNIMMNVEIKNIKERRLAMVEHRGNYERLADSLYKLMNWIDAQSINVKPKPGESFGFAYDDPKTTPTSEFKFDIGVSVPKNLKIEGDVVEKKLPAGRYAVAMHKGPRDKIGDTISQLYRDWLPGSNEELADLPCVFSYLNFDHEVAETEQLTECWLLLK